MANQYVNKVVQSNGTTLIDISDSTAVAADVAQGKYFYLATGEKVQGTATGSGGIATEDVPNATGVTCEITGDELPTIEALSVTQNGTYTATGGGGYSPVTVNVSGGTPSMTQHTIVFTFTDSTSISITAYWDDSFITTAITATVPETYGGKTVNTAALDGTTWYTKPTETWETVYDGNISWYPDSENDYPYCWLSSLSDVSIPGGSVWRVTYDNAQYRCTAVSGKIGNPKWEGGTDDGSNVPFVFHDSGYGAWTGSLNASNVDAQYYFKIERLVTS